MSAEYEKTQDEMELAYNQRRQPGGVYCNHLLDEVRDPQDEVIFWRWDRLLRQYKKSEEGSAEKPYHHCYECKDSCQAEDWAFIDDKYINF